MSKKIEELRVIVAESDDANDFARKGCDAGMLVSMAEGRRLWHNLGGKPKDEEDG